MREIKFRCWSQKENRMIFSDENNLSDFFYGISDGQYGEVEVEQYTGLKDKNGKEIFESDILKSLETSEVYRVDDLFPVHRLTHVTNIGYFSENKYYTRNEPGSQYDNFDDWMSFSEMYEVIGNVWENPELLDNQEGK